jgi:cellulose synthase/poly-beta-1,6-N-acetylglucosamine synthase-like glycosyltransferase
MLAGTGMCFSRQIIQRYGWPALSVGEDWEFSASLLLAGEKIHFNPLACVFQLESSGFRQASGQRLRWAGGRHAVAASSAWKLFRAGLQRQSLYLFDAGLTLVAPNYSSQATLAICALLAARAISVDPAWQFLGIWAAFLVGSLASYFLLGIVSTAAPLRTLSGIALIPVFLPWRLTIEILGFLGYGRKQWIRTPRTPTSTSDTESARNS